MSPRRTAASPWSRVRTPSPWRSASTRSKRASGSLACAGLPRDRRYWHCSRRDPDRGRRCRLDQWPRRVGRDRDARRDALAITATLTSARIPTAAVAPGRGRAPDPEAPSGAPAGTSRCDVCVLWRPARYLRDCSATEMTAEGRLFDFAHGVAGRCDGTRSRRVVDLACHVGSRATKSSRSCSHRAHITARCDLRARDRHR